MHVYTYIYIHTLTFPYSNNGCPTSSFSIAAKVKNNAGYITHEPVFRLRSDIIRNALIQQLEACEKELREGKSAVEGALASDQDLVSPTKGLDEANKKFKDELRHANLHLPKAVKPKAKAKAAAGTA